MPRFALQSWWHPGAVLLTVLACCVIPQARLLAQSTSANTAAPEAVKAAYILNFLRFTTWPGDDRETAPFVIGVSADRDLEDALLRLTDNLRIRDRRIRVIRLRNARDLSECHAVFLDADITVAEEPALPLADGLSTLADRPVLTISSSTGFLAAGGMINLYPEGGNLRFEISAERAAKVGLQFNSRLLALSRPAPSATP